MTINELLDRAKTRANLTSDYALAKALGIDRSIVSGWRKGKQHPSNELAVQLATLAGLEEMPVIAAIEYETATTEKKKQFWKCYLEQHGISAALCLFVIGVSILLTPNTSAASVLQFANYGAPSYVQSDAEIYIMRKKNLQNRPFGILFLKAFLYKVAACFARSKPNALYAI